MQSSGNVKLVDLNKLLTCVLCNGYYIDATTIIECLHSFCRTCIVRYLQSNKFCPTCDVQVHKTKPLLNIRSDQTLQDIVYKLVPDLFKNEMKRRRDFYRQEDVLVQSSIPSSSEKRGDVWGCDRLIFTPEDIISVSLEYSPLNRESNLSLNSLPNLLAVENFHANGDAGKKRKKLAQSDRRYLRCPGALKVHHLKKLLRAKYGLLNSDKKIDVLYMHDVLKDEYTLVDLAYIYSWKRSEPLRLFYKINEEPKLAFSEKNIETFQTNLVISENQVVSLAPATSVCVTLPIVSLAPSVAAAPTSRHPSPPPSPQMAQEPNYFRVANQRVATVQREQDAMLPEPKLKSALKKTTSSFSSEDTQSVLNNLDNSAEEFASKSQLSRGGLSKVKKTPNNIKSKKRVTFSVNLVQNCRIDNSSLQQKVPKYPGHRSLYRVEPVNSSTINNVVRLRNKVLSHKSS
ncbi:polycomb complex protein BMI-1 [Nephila pilipes]|uniref:Polycomb complex protein BMI-1 n=1 Tax=Nephila pilipes TaxID=299642 RepID=A0A8X6TMY8_NEPPI|nr:polycomb complex protein BMI-1 [Nephila pilipes]